MQLVDKDREVFMCPWSHLYPTVSKAEIHAWWDW